MQTRLGSECFLCYGEETNQSSSSTSLTKGREDPTAAQEEGKMAPTGLIWLIFVAAVMLFLVLGLMSWFIRREKRLRRELHDVRLELQDSHQFRDDDPANDFATGIKMCIELSH